MPELTVSEIKLPAIKVGDVTLPDDVIDKLADLDIREKLSEMDLSSVHLPAVLRDVELPDVKLPEIRLPEVAAVAALTRQVRPEPPRRNLLPWIVVAGAATLFAGWFLATSSITAPRVRSAADRVRRRIDDMRGVNNDIIDLDETSTTIWSDDAGWQSGGSGAVGTVDERLATEVEVIDADAAAAADGDDVGWPTPAAASHALADAGMGGTGFEGEAERGDAADREG
jgi:hypothetical protein